MILDLQGDKYSGFKSTITGAVAMDQVQRPAEANKLAEQMSTAAEVRAREKAEARAAQSSVTSYFQFRDCTGFILFSSVEIGALTKPQCSGDMIYHHS